MTTQELKQYIDKVLGNNLRCLLPSYWWKRLFNQVADRIEDVEMSTSQLIDSKVEEAKMPIVESVDDLENLELAKGRVAAVEKAGESATVKISDCYLSTNSNEDWSKYTIVKGVEEKDNVIIDKDTSVFFTASKGIVTKDALQINTHSGIFYYMKWTDDEARVSSLEEVNKALSSGRYRAIQCLNGPDDYFTFYSEKPQPSLYIKGETWEKLSKEYVVSSEEELNALSVENGAIAKVVSGGRIVGSFNSLAVGDRVTEVEFTAPPADSNVVYEVELTNPNGANIRILEEGHLGGWLIGEETHVFASEGAITNQSEIDALNSYLANNDCRLVLYSMSSGDDNIDTFVRPVTKTPIVSNAYIKGDSWERFAKESDLEGNEGGSEDDNSGVELRDLYIYQNYDGTFTQLTEEQKAWNLETLELVKQGKAIVRTTLNGVTFILELFNEDNEYQFGYTQVSPSGGMAISVYVAEDGLSGIKVEESHFDSELSETSENSVQNKVITAALNDKVDKVNGKHLSTEDFTSAFKTKLEGLSNYDDTSIQNAVNSLTTQLNTLVSGDASAAIESFNEIIAFLNGVEDSESLDSIIASIEQQIAGKQDVIEDLETIRSGAAKGATALQEHQDISHLASKEELQNLQNEIIANEEVVAAAFNDVNERINAISENVSGTTVTKEELESAVETINQTISDNKSATDTAIEGLETSIGNVDTKFANYATTESLTTEITNLTNEIIANEEVHAAAINDLNTRLAALEAAIANL